MIDSLKKFLEVAPHQEVMPPEEAEKFYSLGFSLYGVGNYKESADVFEVLCAQWPLEPKHWFALASSRQENSEYEKALHAWAMAAILKTDDPFPHFHAAECCFSLSQKEEASFALASALSRSETHPVLKDKIALLRQQWELKE
ncbi:MAG: tetratricopeptide repeat protein [Verrucomicrobia bacterium]|nr:tetratricopeptide repeat protein [Verrucomicrobiota bacterium]